MLWARMGSDHRHLLYKSSALPLSYSPYRLRGYLEYMTHTPERCCYYNKRSAMDEVAVPYDFQFHMHVSYSSRK